jgi:FkbM family methyltransferase
MAVYLKRGHVYAFEPTDFAFAKLARNLALNPRLVDRVTVTQSFVAERAASVSSLIAYSSWPVTGDVQGERHPVHGGLAKDAGCGQTTLDDFVATECLENLSAIKIDTDGHEFAVLSGAGECLDRFRPIVVFEACEYLLRPPNRTFADFAALFASHRYAICDIHRRHRITAEQFHAKCPRGGSLDLLALPSERFA